MTKEEQKRLAVILHGKQIIRHHRSDEEQQVARSSSRSCNVASTIVIALR